MFAHFAFDQADKRTVSTIETRPRLLTIPEVAERLRVSRMSVYRRIEKGEVPAVRLGGPGCRFASPRTN